MADAAALDPLDEINPYTGESPNQQLAPVVGREAAPVPVNDDASYEALPPGTQFTAPDGSVRKKPWTVKNDRDFESVPEGETFLDPEGNERQKPAYEPLNYTAQTLHSMALNSKEQKKALEYAYPGKVQQDASGEFFVDDGGVKRKAGATRGVKPFLGAATAAAAPTLGAVFGALGGGTAAAPTGPGAVAGAVAGSSAGGVMGQMVNDAIFGLIAGHDRTAGEELTSLGTTALTSAAGTGVGRGIATVVPSVKAGVSAASNMLPGMARSFTGASKEGLERAESLGQRGYAVTPSATMPEAPHLQNVVEVLDPAFRTDKPLVKQNIAAYEKEAGDILERAGVPEFQTKAPPSAAAQQFPEIAAKAEADIKDFKPFGRNSVDRERAIRQQQGDAAADAYRSEFDRLSNEALRTRQAAKGKPNVDDAESLVKPPQTRPSLTDPQAAVPTLRVGEALREKAMTQAAEADAKLAEAFAVRKAALETGAPENLAQREAILRAQEESRRAVDNLLNENYARINQDVERAYGIANAGANSGDAWQQVADQFAQTRRAIGERANKMYTDSHALGGDTPISSAPLSTAAREFAEQLPEEFRATQPAIVRRLEALAGKEETVGPKGEIIPAVPPTDLTFAEAHQLRSIMRANADFSRLNSDVKNGTYKHFNNVLDNAIHDTGAAPNLRAAAKALDQADAFYSEQMPIFNARQLQAVMRGVEAGEPANPIALYRTLVDANNPDMTARIRGMVGPNLWSAVQAAHVDDLMRRSMSKTVRGAVDGPAFARNVLEDYNSGVLGAVQDKAMTDQLLKQVDALAMARGKLDIPVNSGDRMVDVIAKARAAEAEAMKFGNTDPLAAMKKEAQQIDREQGRTMGQARGERRKEPLGFLYDTSVGAQAAADKILSNPDLMLAAAAKFGRESTEFKMLQQAYLWKVLQGDMDPGKALAKVAPEIQHLMVPEATLPQLQALAKDMDFLTGTKLMKGAGDTGSSMMAVSKVEHPLAGKTISRTAKLIPGANAAGRAALTKYYALVSKITSQNPALFTYMLRGLRGSPEEREIVKQGISAVLQRGGAVGAGAGQAAYQMGGSE